MTIIELLTALNDVKFSFGKDYMFLYEFSRKAKAFCMHDYGYGLGISDQLSSENQLRAIFVEVAARNGYFLFNINGVDFNKARLGFVNFDEALDNNMITEWELSMIIGNNDFFQKTIFHNQSVELIKINKGIQLLW